MENKLQIFSNEQFGTVRTIEIKCEDCLVGKDVAEILGYIDTTRTVSVHCLE